MDIIIAIMVVGLGASQSKQARSIMAIVMTHRSGKNCLKSRHARRKKGNDLGLLKRPLS